MEISREELTDKVKALYALKPETTVIEAAIRFNVCKKTINRIRKELGLSKDKAIVTAAEIQEMTRLKLAGVKAMDIAKQLNRPYRTVVCTLSKLKVKKPQKVVPVMELFEQTPANRFITCSWSRANVEAIFQGAQ